MKYFWKTKKGFSLMENLSALLILGMVIVLVVPYGINMKHEANKKTTLKKAVTAYQTALEEIAVSNTGITDTDDLNSVVTCDNIAKKMNTTTNDCVFQTADGLWWDITTKDKILVSFDEDKLSTDEANSKKHKTFYITYSYSNNRINMFSQNEDWGDTVNNAIKDTVDYISK